MARRSLSKVFKPLLLRFAAEQDPLLSMLEWVTQQLMEVEAENKVGAEKGSTLQIAEPISQAIG
jgi:putative transposase